MREFLKKITHPFLKLGLRLYYYKPRKYRYDGISIWVHPDVFPPHLTLSTKILLDFIKSLELGNKTFLELGCGSGIISLFAAKKQAIVTATDINKKALEFLQKNALKNNMNVQIIQSDLFQNLEQKSFDYIIINPPYYPKQPKNIKEQAWFCGENFEYFERLFTQLPDFLGADATILMILSQDCDIQHIESIAKKTNLIFKLLLEKTVTREKNFVYQITKSK